MSYEWVTSTSHQYLSPLFIKYYWIVFIIVIIAAMIAFVIPTIYEIFKDIKRMIKWIKEEGA